MKVVLVSRFPSNIDQPRGGVETATVALAKALFSLGITDLHIVTIEKHLPEICIENHEGLTVHRLRRSRWPMILDAIVGPSVRILNQYLRKLEPTVVHYHETWGFSAPKCGFPAVFTVHGFDSLNLATEKAPFWRTRSKLWAWAESIGLQKQKHIISIAPYVHGAINLQRTHLLLLLQYTCCAMYVCMCITSCAMHVCMHVRYSIVCMCIYLQGLEYQSKSCKIEPEYVCIILAEHH